MKNIMFIVLDSITNDQAFNSSTTNIKLPFISSLRESSITGNKMYSQAPYTEAALVSLLGSFDTLDMGGYLEKFKNKKSVFDYLNDKGYITYFPTYYPSIYPSYMDYGAKKINYTDIFNFNHAWSYRLSHYCHDYLNNRTTDKENIFLISLLEDNLNSWIKYLMLLKNNDSKTYMINNYINRNNLDESIKSLENELKLFKKNKIDYLTNLFIMKENHILFKINMHKYVDKINDDEYRMWFIDNYESTFKRIKKIQLKKNIVNAKFPYKKLFANINDKNIVKGLLAGYKNLLVDKDIMNRVNSHFDLFKAQRSFNAVVDDTISKIEEFEKEKKPWVTYVHVDDAHSVENFFSYDSNDKELIKKEFANINDFLNKLPKDYCGTISSDLSLLYCDSKVQKIYDYLKGNDMLKKTSIVITADHGFSYYFNPIREKYVISSYKENYNVPFIIYDENIIPKKINGYLATKDIPATILDLANVTIPKTFKGKSLLSFEGRKFSTIEYMGGGCPDMSRRPMILGIRDDNYTVIMNVYKNLPFNKATIEEVYDMRCDVHENNNLKNRKNIKNIVKYEVELIKKRYEEIRGEK